MGIPSLGNKRHSENCDAEDDSIAVDRYKTRVVGSALATISYTEPALYESEKDEEYEREIPFNFDITFLPDLQVKQIHFLEFDASEYDF